MANISNNIRNFIKEHQNLINSGDWVELFYNSFYELNNYESADLALMLKDAGILIDIKDVFSKEYEYTDYIEDDMSSNVTIAMLEQLNNELDLDYSKELKEYPFNKVLDVLSKSYVFTPTLKDLYRDNQYDSSPIVKFKYLLFKPENYKGAIRIGFTIKSADGHYIKIYTNGLPEKLIDYRAGFGIGYNKVNLNKYVKENHLDPLLLRLNHG